MTAAKTVVTRYFSVDADHDISGDAVSFSLDEVTWTPGTFIPSPTAAMLAASPRVATGLTRYWWAVTFGPGNTLVPNLGNSSVYGRVIDNPQTLYFGWEITTTL
jgi:hypothetical protein